MFAPFDAEIWDRQLETNARNGKLLGSAERVLRDHESDQSTTL
jgi:hypothetical protein